MQKVLNFDSCSVFINDIFSTNELFLTLKKNFKNETTDYIKNLTFNSIESFFSKTINFNKIKIMKIKSTIQQHMKVYISQITNSCSFNFRNTIFGIISITSFNENAFQKNVKDFCCHSK